MCLYFLHSDVVVLMARQGPESSSYTFTSFIVPCFILAIALHGCGEEASCPDAAVPIANGMVTLACRHENSVGCERKRVKCHSGYGYSVLPEDVSDPQITRVAGSCVVEFNKEPRYCHKCLDNTNITIAGGVFRLEEGTTPEALHNEPIETIFNVTCDNGRIPFYKSGKSRMLRGYVGMFAAPESLCIFNITTNACLWSEKSGRKWDEKQKKRKEREQRANKKRIEDALNKKKKRTKFWVDGKWSSTPEAKSSLASREAKSSTGFNASLSHNSAHDVELDGLIPIRPWLLAGAAPRDRE